MRSMCVGVAETGVKAFLFLSFSFFSDKRKEHYKKSFFVFLFLVAEIWRWLAAATQNRKDAFLSRTILSQCVGQKSEKCIEKFTDIWYYIK